MSKFRIPIKAAERLSEAHGCPIVIIYALNADGSQFNLTTYGKTKALCRHAADIGEKFAQAVLNGTVKPAAEQPVDLPGRAD